MEMLRGTVAGYHGNGGTPVTVSGWPGYRNLCTLGSDFRSHALLWLSDQRAPTREACDALPQRRRISAIPHLWGRPGLQFWCKLQPAGTILPEQGAVLTP